MSAAAKADLLTARERTDARVFQVEGDHGTYEVVTWPNQAAICTCPAGMVARKAGLSTGCSHALAAIRETRAPIVDLGCDGGERDVPLIRGACA